MSEADDALEREIGVRVRRWLDLVERVPREAYTFVASAAELPPQARAESVFWAREALLPAAVPYDAPGGARHGFHVATQDTMDLLRHEIDTEGLDLVLVEGRNFGLVRVGRGLLDVLAIPEPERRPAIDGLAQRILRADPGRALVFHFAGKVEDGCQGCTAPGVDPLLVTSPREREEALVRGGSLTLLYYKRVAQEVGFRNARQWFEDELRAPVTGR